MIRTLTLLVLTALSAAAAPPAWHPRLTGVEPPAHPARGRIGREPFRVDRVRFTQNLRLQQLDGERVVRELVLWFSYGRNAVLPDWRRLAFDANPRSRAAFDLPEIHLRRRGGRQTREQTYALKVELDPPTGPVGTTGRIYLCVHDARRSVVAGTFRLVFAPVEHRSGLNQLRALAALRARGERPDSLRWVRHGGTSNGPSHGLARYRHDGRWRLARVRTFLDGKTVRAEVLAISR